MEETILRRIPYKIETPDPTEEQFRALCKLMAPMLGFGIDEAAIEYLIETHYRKVGRPYRACQPRDLIVQVRNYCAYKTLPLKLSPEAFDFAVDNYFAVM